MTDDDTREQVVLSLENSARWRSAKAAEYPDDARNARAASALAAAAREVAALPADDARLDRLARFFASVDDDAVGAYVEEQSRIIGRHGFDVPEATTDELLASLLSLTEQAGLDSLDRQADSPEPPPRPCAGAAQG